MAENSKIEWTHHTFNPWRGCTKVAAGCANCYADSQAKRNPKTLGIWGDQGTRVVASESMWRQPLKWDGWARDGVCYNCGGKGRRKNEGRCAVCDGRGIIAPYRGRVFCASMADVFEGWEKIMRSSKGLYLHHADKWQKSQHGSPYVEIADIAIGKSRVTMADVRARLFSLIDATPHLDWLLLTKRPENIPAMWPHADQHANEYPPAPSEEIMQPIEGYPNYFVSNFGLVYSSNGSHCCLFCGKHIEGGVANRKYCDQRCNDNAYKSRRRGDAQQVEQSMRQVAVDVGDQGHCRVTLYRDGESRRELVHRLVLTAFVRPPERGEQGCHRDRNPKNNRIDNLRWGTQSGNWDDSIHHGTHRRSNKLTEHQVADIRSRLASGESYAALGRSYSVSATQIGNIDKNLQWRETTGFRRNCWIGCSIANQADADRNIPLLLKCRDLSPVLFVSAEPLLGPVDLKICPLIGDHKGDAEYKNDFQNSRIDWLICGGESGPNARPMHPDWARSLRDQCQAAGVPFFFKQGSQADWKNFKEFTSFPADLQIREFPNAAR